LPSTERGSSKSGCEGASRYAEPELTGGTLLDYRTSGDATGDRSTVVGYAAISFLKEASDD